VDGDLTGELNMIASRPRRRLCTLIVILVCLAASTGGPLVAAAQGAGFEPTISVTADSSATDSPSGLQVELDLAGGGELSRADLILPRGLSLDPSALAGLAGCSPAEIGLTTPAGTTPAAFDAEPVDCPEASRIGSAEVESPLFGHPLSGSIYLASQGQNPFGSLLALYVAVEEPEAAVLVKLAGKVTLDAQTGQLTVAFDEVPQLGIERATLDVPGGPNALLTTPPTCGVHSAEAELATWEGADAHLQGHFEFSEGPGGSACVSTEAEEPDRPGFSAATSSAQAGAYSPFLMRLSREDGSQRIDALDFTLPPGLLGKLAGIAVCPDAQIAQAQARSREGEGALEQASPSCPTSSQIGTITVGSGSGDPLLAHGHVYLSGPYRGAPLSLVAITPARVGPFDLGVVVDHVATYVNPITAQINPVTETIPTILHGIPLDIRSIAVELDRDQFILNPTNCNPMATTGFTTSTLGRTAPISSPFQATGCDALPFRPHLKLRLKGRTRRAASPALSAVLTTKPGEASSASGRVTLPGSEFVDNAHLGQICTRVQFAAGTGTGSQCPPGSIYGHARVSTPLIDVPEEGPVFLRSDPENASGLPDLVAALRGPDFQPIAIDLVGKVDSGPGGGIRTTFETIPDAPITRFELRMDGGHKGLIENSENLCAPHARTRASVDLGGQNGKRYDTRPKVQNSCRHRRRRAHD
jgi:hypothetical protein